MSDCANDLKQVAATIRPHYPVGADVCQQASSRVSKIETVAAAAVKHWREVMEHDFDGVTGGDTEYITNKLAKAIGVDK